MSPIVAKVVGEPLSNEIRSVKSVNTIVTISPSGLILMDLSSTR